jgi:hypothetical protein
MTRLRVITSWSGNEFRRIETADNTADVIDAYIDDVIVASHEISNSQEFPTGSDVVVTVAVITLQASSRNRQPKGLVRTENQAVGNICVRLLRTRTYPLTSFHKIVV